MSATTLPFDTEQAAPTSSPITAQSLLERLRFRGVVVEAQDNQLSFDAPTGALTDLLPDLQKFKPQLIELVASAKADNELGENRLEILRALRLAGASLHLENVDGETRLVWQLPEDKPTEWREHCASWIEREREFIFRRFRFERWHWNLCAEHFGENGKRLDNAPAYVFHRDWKQFYRFSVGSQDTADLHDLARAALASRRPGGGLDYGKFKVAFRIVCELGGREVGSNIVMQWARTVLEGEAQ